MHHHNTQIGLKLLNKDERISRRYVLHVLKDISSNLISQKLLDRTLGREMNLYTKIECFEFKKEAYIAEDVKTCLLGGRDVVAILSLFLHFTKTKYGKMRLKSDPTFRIFHQIVFLIGFFIAYVYLH